MLVVKVAFRELLLSIKLLRSIFNSIPNEILAMIRLNFSFHFTKVCFLTEKNGHYKPIFLFLHTKTGFMV